MEQNKNDEIDLGMIYNKIRGLYHDFLVFLYHIYQFILKSWVILLILIVIGVIYGLIKDSNPEKERETTLLVQINGDAVMNVYDAVQQFQDKLKEKDTILLKKMGFYNNEVKFIQSVKIEPVVNVLDIIDQTEVNNRNLEIIVDETQYEDEVLKSEIFIPEYRIHKISVITHYWANQSHINLFMAYLNDNKAINRIKEVAKRNLKFRIDRNFESIAYMDSIFNTYGKPVTEITRSQQDKISIVDINITNIHMLFEEKRLLMEQNQKLEMEYANFEETVELLNKPMLSIKKNILDKKKIVYPVLLVFFFFLSAMVRFYFKKAKNLSLQKD